MRRDELALLCVCMCWVRMKRSAPSATELVRLVRKAFPGLEPTQSLAGQAVRAGNCIASLYSREDLKAMSASPSSASTLSISLWCACCTEPPPSGTFTDWLQVFFPKLDGLELARLGAWAEQQLIEIYGWWSRDQQPLKRTILRRRVKR